MKKLKRIFATVALLATILSLTNGCNKDVEKEIPATTGKAKEEFSSSTLVPIAETEVDATEKQENTLCLDRLTLGPEFEVKSGKKTCLSGYIILSDEYGVPYEIKMSGAVGGEYYNLCIDCSYIIVDNQVVPVPRQSQLEGLDQTFKDPYNEINTYIDYLMQNENPYYSTEWRITPSPETVNWITNDDGTITGTYDFKLISGNIYTRVVNYSDPTCELLLSSYIQNGDGEIVSTSSLNAINESVGRVFMGFDKPDEIWESVSIDGDFVYIKRFDENGTPIVCYDTYLDGDSENNVHKRYTSYSDCYSYEMISEKGGQFPTKILMPNGVVLFPDYNDQNQLIAITTTNSMTNETSGLTFSTPINLFKYAAYTIKTPDELDIYDTEIKTYYKLFVDDQGFITCYCGNELYASTSFNNDSTSSHVNPNTSPYDNSHILRITKLK